MAVYTDKVVLELDAKLSKYHADLLSGQRRFDDVMQKMQRGLKSVESQSVITFSRMTTALSAVGGAIGIAQITRYADAWTDLSSRVGLAVGDMERAPEVMERLYSMAQRTYTEFNTTAEGFLGFSTALKEMGLSVNQSLDVVESFNNAMVVSGAKAERAASLQFALSKALGQGALKGDEFNRVMEIGGRFTELLAEHFGTTQGGLRNLAQEGKITGAVISEVLTKNLERLREEADSMPATISDGFMRIQNALWRYIGTMDQAHGASGAVAQVLVTLSDNFDLVANGALISAGILLSRYTPSLMRAAAAQAAVIATNPFALLAVAIGAAATALITFGDQIKVFEGDLAGANDYAAVVFDDIRGIAERLSDKLKDVFDDMSNFIVQAFEGVGVPWENVTNFIQGAVNKIIAMVRAAHGIAVAVFTGLPAAIADGVISAVNAMVSAVESAFQKIVDGYNRFIGPLQTFLVLTGQSVTARNLPTLKGVDLGRVENSFEGAASDLASEISSVIEEAFSRDYVEEGKNALDSYVDGVQQRANQRAANRAINQMNELLLGGGEDDGIGGGAPPPGGIAGAGGKGRKGRGGRDAEDFAKELQQLRERTDLLRAETAALSEIDPLAEDYEKQVTRTRIEQELLNKAQEAGVALSPQVRAGIAAMAEAYAQADEEARKLREQHQELQQRHQEWVDTQKDAMKGFIKDLAAGKTATEALAGALQKLADKLMDLALDNLFSGLGGGGGGFLGQLVGAVFGRRAAGGSARKGMPYLVNENTPNSEVFVPSENGAILNVPQAQDALAKAARITSAYGNGSQVQPSASKMLVKTEASFNFNLEGANGDKAIEEAVNRGIRQAAPILRDQAVKQSVQVVSKMSREGTKSFLGI